MSKLQKLSYVVGISGIGLLFLGLKTPILSLVGFSVILSSIVIYGADKYLCSSADVVMPDVAVSDSRSNEPRPSESLGRDIDRKEAAKPSANVPVGDSSRANPITYRYDIVVDPVDQVPAVVGIKKQINNYVGKGK